MHAWCGKIWRQINILSFTKFPGKFRRQNRASLPLIGELLPHRKSSAQLWTASDDNVPYTYERSLSQFLFRNLEHFNYGIKFRLYACLKRINTEIVSARAFIWKVFIPQSWDNQTAFKSDQHTTRHTLGDHTAVNCKLLTCSQSESSMLTRDRAWPISAHAEMAVQWTYRAITGGKFVCACATICAA